MGEKKYDIVILGGGESGVGAALLAQKSGLNVLVSDNGSIALNYQIELKQNDIDYEENGHSEAIILQSDEVIKSPGIPGTAPLILKIKEAGISVISEIEFASRYYNGTVIGITGSNGKTTTTSLIYHILLHAGQNVGVVGNIGKSFARQLVEESKKIMVVELSSFQLDDIIDFFPHVAVLLNITPDHLDRYDNNIANYVASKFRIIENQTNEDAFITFEEDDLIRNYLKRNPADSNLTWFYSTKKNDIENEISFEHLKIKGPHNKLNAVAAALVVKELGISNELIQRGLNTFQPIEHRLQLVDTIDGVEYVNDSKATNVDATKQALASFDNPIIWIVGGVDKGNDYSELSSVMDNVKAIVCLGTDNSKIIGYYSNKINSIVETGSMEEAIARASEIAQSGDVVLLSPACASFDLFDNYEDRGNQFIIETKKKLNEDELMTIN